MLLLIYIDVCMNVYVCMCVHSRVHHMNIPNKKKENTT